MLAKNENPTLRAQVETQLKQTLKKIQPDRLFVSVGRNYWALLADPLARHVAPGQVAVATGSIGGRASQLAHWLRYGKTEAGKKTRLPAVGEATLLGTAIRLNRAEVLRRAKCAFLIDPKAASHFETWYVSLGHDRVAPKWLVSILFDKPVARFRTADARRILSKLGVRCQYVSAR
jgi:hypothetical protein